MEQGGDGVVDLPSVIGYLLAIGYRLLVIIVCLQSLNRFPGGVSFRKS
jgi:hypothetical protein